LERRPIPAFNGCLCAAFAGLPPMGPETRSTVDPAFLFLAAPLGNLPGPRAIESANRLNSQKEIAMKRMMIGLVLAICACGHVARASSEDPISGRWRGVLTKGAMTSVVQFEFSREGSVYRGKYWREAPTGGPLALSDIQIGPEIHFDVEPLGVFEGAFQGQEIKGTFTDGQGSGSFTLEKQPQWDDVMYAP